MAKNDLKFSIALDGKPDQEISYEAALFQTNGTLIEAKKVENDQFTMAVHPEVLKRSRLLIYPVQAKSGRKQPTKIEDALKLQAYEPVLPAYKGEAIALRPIPEYYWRCWFFCECVVTGTVWNNICNAPSPVPQARVHICEVESIFYWLRMLADEDILSIRNDIWYALNPNLPNPPDPGPERTFKELPADEAVTALKTNMPINNLAHFHSSQASLVRGYLRENIMYFNPLFCYFHWWWWLRCEEIAVVETSDAGTFAYDFWYPCCVSPAVYLWVEYMINGIWQTVYHPFIGCGAWWEYACGAPINIYLNDVRVPCVGNPNYTGANNAIVIITIGNNVNVNQIPQTAPGSGINNMGLMPGNAPFGGQLEPRVLFSENLAGNYWYRWSYSPHGANTWMPLNASVGRHYYHWVGNTLSFPVHNLGPQTKGATPNLFEIQAASGPGGAQWAIVDNRYDLPSAFFYSTLLNNGDVVAAAGFYDLKFEVFDISGNLVDLTAAGIDLLVVDKTQSAPFGAQTLNTAAPDAINQIISGGHVMGFQLVIRVDNNPVTATINPITSDGAGNCNAGTDCGFITFVDILTSRTHLNYQPQHPNNFATFSFTVTKGTYGTVHSAHGNLLDPTPSITFDAGTSAHPYAQPVGAITESADDDFAYDVTVGDLIGSCSKAAFAAWLYIQGTANDGYGWTGIQNSAAQTFAMINEADCA
jgi:hypothetical protein